jgi:hypothetical protein
MATRPEPLSRRSRSGPPLSGGRLSSDPLSRTCEPRWRRWSCSATSTPIPSPRCCRRQDPQHRVPPLGDGGVVGLRRHGPRQPRLPAFKRSFGIAPGTYRGQQHGSPGSVATPMPPRSRNRSPGVWEHVLFRAGRTGSTRRPWRCGCARASATRTARSSRPRASGGPSRRSSGSCWRPTATTGTPSAGRAWSVCRNDLSPAEALELVCTGQGEVDIVSEVFPADDRTRLVEEVFAGHAHPLAGLTPTTRPGCRWASAPTGTTPTRPATCWPPRAGRRAGSCAWPPRRRWRPRPAACPRTSPPPSRRGRPDPGPGRPDPGRPARPGREGAAPSPSTCWCSPGWTCPPTPLRPSCTASSSTAPAPSVPDRSSRGSTTCWPGSPPPPTRHPGRPHHRPRPPRLRPGPGRLPGRPEALYAVNRHVSFDGCAAAFELAETEVAPGALVPPLTAAPARRGWPGSGQLGLGGQNSGWSFS